MRPRDIYGEELSVNDVVIVHKPARDEFPGWVSEGDDGLPLDETMDIYDCAVVKVVEFDMTYQNECIAYLENCNGFSFNTRWLEKLVEDDIELDDSELMSFIGDFKGG